LGTRTSLKSKKAIALPEQDVRSPFSKQTPLLLESAVKYQYIKDLHPAWDSVFTLKGNRYRLIQQYQDNPLWDVSLPDRRDLLGQIAWIEDGSRIFPTSGKFAIVNIRRQPITPAAIFDTWQEAVLELYAIVCCIKSNRTCDLRSGEVVSVYQSATAEIVTANGSWVLEVN
jgi:hypothetical protein